MVEVLLAALMFGTIGATLFFAWRSREATKDKLKSDTKPSTLAADGPDTRD